MKTLVAAAMVLFCGSAAAQEPGFQAVSGGKLAETLLGLVLVLGLIFVLARVLQRMQGNIGGGNQVMQVVSILSVGARERIMLLKVADKHILVSATAQSISPLHVFDEFPAELAEAEQTSSGFASLLQSFNGGQKS